MISTIPSAPAQILAVNQTGGGFFEPILHSKCLDSKK